MSLHIKSFASPPTACHKFREIEALLHLLFFRRLCTLLLYRLLDVVPEAKAKVHADVRGLLVLFQVIAVRDEGDGVVALATGAGGLQ